MGRKLPGSIVLAFGGNALKEEGPDGNTIEAQERAMRRAADIIATIKRGVDEVAVVHGNGPQVGWMARRSELGVEHAGMHPVHLCNLVASSQGAIGTSMARQVVNVDSSLRGKIVEIGTQVEVDPNDPAFERPTKPIGSYMTKGEADKMRGKDGCVIEERRDAPDKSRPFRRVVASPYPVCIEEIEPIETLVRRGIIVVCGGGGGIPFVREKDGTIRWVNAVVDKDLAGALIAKDVSAQVFAIFTASDGIYDPDDFRRVRDGDHSVKPIPRLSVAELAQIVHMFPSGSMGPKAEALYRFSHFAGHQSWVGPLDGGYEAFMGGGGTTIVPA